jgi:hypothetical protein
MKTTNHHNKVSRDSITRTKNSTVGNAAGLGRRLVAPLLAGILGFFSLSAARAAFDLGAAAPYTVLYEGTDSVRLDASASLEGDIGLAKGATLYLNPTSQIKGNVNFAGATNIKGGNLVTGSISGNVGDVTTAINDMNAFSLTKAALYGTDLKVNLPGDQTINATAGTLNGNDYVFNVTAFKFEGGKTLTINAGVAGNNVVFNCASLKNADFNGIIILNGLTMNDVLWNFSSSDQTVGFDTDLGFKGKADVEGIFLNPHGTITIGGNAEVCGRVFGGVEGNLRINGGTQINATCDVVPEPSTYLLMGIGTLVMGIVYRRKTQSN